MKSLHSYEHRNLRFALLFRFYGVQPYIIVYINLHIDTQRKFLLHATVNFKRELFPYYIINFSRKLHIILLMKALHNDVSNSKIYSKFENKFSSYFMNLVHKKWIL
jgi:hypothetical protein